MWTEVALLLIRHAMTSAGPVTIAGSGVAVDAQTVAGAILTLAGLAWSAWRKWRRA